LSKIQTFVKNRNFCEKSKLLPKIETFVNKIMLKISEKKYGVKNRVRPSGVVWVLVNFFGKI